MKKEILLVDGNALFFKSFWSTWFQIKDNPNANDVRPDGTPVNAVRVFSTMMINLKRDFNPDKMLVAFDERGGHTHRHQYDFYKAGRAEQPQELYDQMPLVKTFLEHYGIRHHSQKIYEADDIIGILAKEAKREGWKVSIITTDKDLLQLVEEDIDVYLSKTGVSSMELHNMHNFKDLNDGLTPIQIIDFKGIAGDNSDNLKGVKGIGPKGAIKLINEYGSLENIIENKDKHTPGIRSKLIEFEKDALLSKELAKILVEGDLDITLYDIDVEEPNWDKLIDFFTEMGIHSVKKKLNDERERKWK